MLLRATSHAVTDVPTSGFIALLTPVDLVDRVNYDHSVDALDLDTGAGKDKVAMDDTAAPVTIDGSAGADLFQVGQVFGKQRTTANGIALPDVFATETIAEGELSRGISYATTIEGGDGNDVFNVYSNKGEITLDGGNDDDTFTVRAFVSGHLNMKGKAGTNKYRIAPAVLLPNSAVTIDGGEGNDTVVGVGTQRDDKFVVTTNGIQICVGTPFVCGVNVTFTNVESLVAQGLGGDDLFEVRSTSTVLSTALYGGDHSDRFLIGNQGDVTGIQGPLRITGQSDPGFDASIPLPVVLPGEDAEGSHPDANGTGTNTGDKLQIDASNDLSGDAGTLQVDSVTGLGMGAGISVNGIPYPAGVSYADIQLINVFLDGEADTFDVRSVTAATKVDGGGGNDTVRIGSLAPALGGDLFAIDGLVDVVGGTDSDKVFVDSTGNGTAGTLTSTQGKITGLGLSPAGITHSTIELLDVSMGAGADVADLQGSSTNTVVHGGPGNDRFYVSDAATVTPSTSITYLGGTLDKIAGPVTLDGGAGTHTLMVSDDDATAGDGSIAVPAVIDETSIKGLSTGSITYGASGTFAGGITVWTSQGADVINLDGTRRDGGATLTTLNTNKGDDRIASALDTPADGTVNVYLEEGNDSFTGGAHTLPLVVHGDIGNDSITGADGPDLLLGQAGADTVRGAGGDDRIEGGAGADSAYGARARTTSSAAARRCTCRPARRPRMWATPATRS